jgi:hypothetical protein
MQRESADHIRRRVQALLFCLLPFATSRHCDQAINSSLSSRFYTLKSSELFILFNLFIVSLNIIDIFV